MSPTSGKMTQLTQLIDSMKKLLIETKCGKIVQSNQKIIEIDASMSVSEGCRVLVDHQISSAPVVISNQTEDNRRLYIGMLDYRDIVEYCLAVFGKRFSPLSEEGEIRSADGGESCSSEFSCIEDVVRRASSGENVSIADITGKFLLDISFFLDGLKFNM